MPWSNHGKLWRRLFLSGHRRLPSRQAQSCDVVGDKCPDDRHAIDVWAKLVGTGKRGDSIWAGSEDHRMVFALFPHALGHCRFECNSSKPDEWATWLSAD